MYKNDIKIQLTKLRSNKDFTIHDGPKIGSGKEQRVFFFNVLATDSGVYMLPCVHMVGNMKQYNVNVIVITFTRYPLVNEPREPKQGR